MKRTFFVYILTCLLLAIIVPGCVEPPDKSTPKETSPATVGKETAPPPESSTSPPQTKLTPTAPLPVTVELSFPEGAPPLNQTRELRCTIKTLRIGIDPHVDINIQLPDGFELVSGELSWAGTVPEDSSIDVVSAVVKSIKVGNWTIDETHNIEVYSGPGGGRIYVAVSEDSAEWGKYPPWTREGGYPVPPVQSEGPVIIKEFSISHAPVLGEPADLTLTVLTRDDMPDSTVRIMLPEGAAVIDGNLEWHGDLKAGVPVTLSAKIVFKKTGNWRIYGGYWQWVGKENSWGVFHSIYLIIGVNNSSFGQPPEPSDESRPIPPTTIEPVDN